MWTLGIFKADIEAAMLAATFSTVCNPGMKLWTFVSSTALLRRGMSVTWFHETSCKIVRAT